MLARLAAVPFLLAAHAASAFEPARECLDDHPGTRAKTAAGISIEWTEAVPMVIPADRPASSPVVFRARATGAPGALRIVTTNGGPQLSLLDNGVSPDTVAGDGVYAGNIPMPEITARNVPERYDRPIIGKLQAVVGGVLQAQPAINVVLDVAPADLPIVPVVQRIGTPSYRFTTHVVNLRDDAFYTDFDWERVVASVLPSLGDRFDFVDIVWAPREYVQNRFHGRIRNSITGIGLDLFDAGANFASPARLKGFTNFPTVGLYEPAESGYVHEIGHQWINALDGTLADGAGGGHWPVGPIATHVMGFSGQGGQGQDLTCRMTRASGVVSGQYRPAERVFNDYELYLMGLVPPSAVAPSWIFTDKAGVTAATSQPNFCSANMPYATTDVSVNTIIAQHGARTPNASGSQRHYKVLTLVVSFGRSLDATEMSYLTALAKHHEARAPVPVGVGLTTEQGLNFHLATGGRARTDAMIDRFFEDGLE